MAKANLIISMPFVLAEACTGIVSLLTGELRIPPYVGTDTAVDLIIFLAGLVVAIVRMLKLKPMEAEMTHEFKNR